MSASSGTAAASAQQLSSANRVNVPAVCRIPGRGTAFLVSPGLLMTSHLVVGTKSEAARLTAVFFETGKREPVEVRLLPSQFYFAAAYPEHLDYCLVACETKGIFHVAPVRLPTVRTEWSQVREGDVLLTMQHPVVTSATAVAPDASTTAVGAPSVPTEVKSFEDVIRRRDDLMYLRTNGSYTTAGCPVFNEAGDFVGIQAQQYYDGVAGGVSHIGDRSPDKLQSRVVAATTIVKHMFANGHLSRIDHQPQPNFADVWATWSVPNDIGRVVGIILNYPHPSIAKPASEQLFEHAMRRELITSVVSCGATRVIIDAVKRFASDEAFVVAGLRSLWNVSFGEVDNCQEIVNAEGPDAIVAAMGAFPANEEIATFATVVLYNLTLSATLCKLPFAQSALTHVINSVGRFPNCEVVQKFGVGYLRNLVTHCGANLVGQPLVDSGSLQIAASALMRFPANEYLAENTVSLVSEIARCPKFQGSPALFCCVDPIVAAMKRFGNSNVVRVEGNNALWGLGADPRCRALIFKNPDGIDVLRNSIMLVSDALA